MALSGRGVAHIAVITAAFVVSAAPHAISATSASLRIGDRVRLTAPTVDSSPLVGRIVSVDSMQVTVDVAKQGEAASERSIDREALTRIERSNGYQRNTSRGAWTGFGLGVLTSVGVGLVAARNSGDVHLPLDAPLWWGTVGALGGIIIGSTSSSERWSRLQPAAPSAPLAVGDRARLTAPALDSSPIVGRIVSVDSTQLTVDVPKKGERSIDWESLTRIESSEGYESNVGLGALIGAGIGVLASAVAYYRLIPGPRFEGDMTEYALLGVTGGALVGATIGGAASGERWRSMPNDARAELQLAAPSAPLAASVPDSVLRIDAPAGVLKIGDRVRLTAPTQPPSPVAGRLASADDSKLTIVVSEETRMAPAVKRTIERESLTRLERGEPFKSKAGAGALIGGTLGVLAGVGVGYVAAMAGGDGQPLFTAPLIFGSMGVLAGAGVGAAISGERWRALPPDTQVGFRPGTGSEPFTVVIRTTF